MALRKKTLVDQAADYVGALKPHVEAAYGSAVDFVQDTAIPAWADAKDKAGPALADARDKAVPVLVDARDRARPVLADARDKAAPVLTDARDRAVAGLADAREKAAPLVAQGAVLAAEKASAARQFADAKVAELSAAPEPPKKSKLKRFLLIAGLAGGVAVVARKLQGTKTSNDNWQSSYTPAPAPAASSGGASPDEAIADAAESTAPVSTPDEPVTVVEIDPTGKKG